MNTDQVKEGVYMPNYYETGQLGENPDQAVADLVDYLSRLAPAGGCPEDPPVGGERTE